MINENAKVKGWSTDQQGKIHRFYEENWQRFGTALPAVVVMRTDHNWFHRYLQMVMGMNKSMNKKKCFIRNWVSWLSGCDHLTSSITIPPSELRYYIFPMIKFASR